MKKNELINILKEECEAGMIDKFTNDIRKSIFDEIIQLIEDLDFSDNWISCTDKLPEPMKPVLCHMVDGEYKVMKKEPGNKYWQTEFKHIFREDMVDKWIEIPEVDGGNTL